MGKWDYADHRAENTNDHHAVEFSLRKKKMTLRAVLLFILACTLAASQRYRYTVLSKYW
jgi:hypothetical protein